MRSGKRRVRLKAYPQARPRSNVGLNDLLGADDVVSRPPRDAWLPLPDQWLYKALKHDANKSDDRLRSSLLGRMRRTAFVADRLAVSRLLLS